MIYSALNYISASFTIAIPEYSWYMYDVSYLSITDDNSHLLQIPRIMMRNIAFICTSLPPRQRTTTTRLRHLQVCAAISYNSPPSPTISLATSQLPRQRCLLHVASISVTPVSSILNLELRAWTASVQNASSKDETQPAAAVEAHDGLAIDDTDMKTGNITTINLGARGLTLQLEARELVAQRAQGYRPSFLGRVSVDSAAHLLFRGPVIADRRSG